MNTRRLLRFRRARSAFMAKMCTYLASVLLLAGVLHALDPNKHVSQYIHTSWRTQDGSAPAGMYAITQTSDGFLWFVASGGTIYRFDGVKFRPWLPPPDVTVVGRIKNILGDKAGGLWLLGAGGVAHLKDGIVTSHVELDGLLPDPHNVSEDPDGSIWVVRGDNSVSEPLCHVTDRGAKCFGKSDGIPIAPLDAILADGKGGFWLGGQTALLHWHAGVSDVYPIQGLAETGAPGILSLARGPDGSIWMGTSDEGPGGGLARLEQGKIRSFITPVFDGSKIVPFTLRFDRDGNLWAGSGNKGVFRVHGNTVDHYSRTEGLSGDFVRTLLEDREGIVWVATKDGIDRFHDPRVVTFSAVEGLSRDWAVGVLADRDGTIWVANAVYLDRIVHDSVSSIPSPGQVTSLLEDRAGNLWVGIEDGLSLFKDGRFRPLPDPNHRSLGLVHGLVEDTDGNIWAECSGARTGKLLRIRDFKVQQEFFPPQMPTGLIAPSAHGGIWIGTHSGELVLFRNGALQKFPAHPNSESGLNQILALPDDTVLAAFDDGLVGLRQGQVQKMTTKNGLPCDGVNSFARAVDKGWWLNTQCGIVEFSDSELQRWWANPDTVIQTRFFDVLDGAYPGRATFNPAAVSPDGRVWFVSSGVIQMVNPSGLPEKAAPAVTYVESVTADRRAFEATGNLRLPPNPRDLQIDYTSPTFTIPQRVKFRYRLDPYDRDWHEAGTRRQAFYTDLPPGKYSFRVIACNSDGVWNEKGAALEFAILPSWYQTNWFRALCAAALLATIWGIYELRLRQLAHQFNLRLEERIAERTRIARDLHDTLLQSFQGLLFRLQAVLIQIPRRPEKACEALESAITSAEQAIAEGRTAVQELRSGSESTLEQALLDLSRELASSQNGADGSPTVRVIIEGNRRAKRAAIRDEVHRIARELLRNAYKHAHAQKIEAELRYDPDAFVLVVRDDGKGIDPEVLKNRGRAGHWGLPGMYERAEGMGARLDIWSKAGAGTEVRLRVPAAIAYEKPGEGSTRESYF